MMMMVPSPSPRWTTPRGVRAVETQGLQRTQRATPPNREGNSTPTQRALLLIPSLKRLPMAISRLTAIVRHRSALFFVHLPTPPTGRPSPLWTLWVRQRRPKNRP